jgi:nitrite reductase/ring-hydroxylating ferredoxin subunit
MNSRRNFIKKSCAACIGLSAMGLLLDACVSSQNLLKPALENNRFQIALDKFQSSAHYIVRHKTLPFDILVVKNKEQYTALQMRCTHNDVALNFAGKKLVCTAHGSEFDLQGKVLKEPASASLTTYRTSVQDQFLTIQLS